MDYKKINKENSFKSKIKNPADSYPNDFFDLFGIDKDSDVKDPADDVAVEKNMHI